MAPGTIRKVIGAMKDQTSIGIVKVASNMAPELEVAIVKATGHDNYPTSEKYVREILHLTSSSRGYVSACVVSMSKRLGKTRDWIVALKCLTLIHWLINEGDFVFQQEFMYATKRGTRLLNLSDFQDEAHSNSWDHSTFVKTYAMYLDQKLELMAYEHKMIGNGDEIERYGDREDRYRDESPPGPKRGHNYDYNEFHDDQNYGMHWSMSSGDVKESTQQESKDVTPLREMKPERIFGKMGHLQRLLDRFLSCRPTGLAKNERMISVALYAIVKDSFKLYADICEVLAVLLDKFFDMEYQDCIKTFDVYASAAKQIDELVRFYNWCNDIGIARYSEYPEVQKIDSKLLESLEQFVWDRKKATMSPERKVEIEPPPPPPQNYEAVPSVNEIRALPAPEHNPLPPPPQSQPPKPTKMETANLVDLTADAQGDKLALALFAGATTNDRSNPWEDSQTADWESALVESASHLYKQKADMGGGIDSLLLNGMYDQGTVRQHVSTTQLSRGSASSVALPGGVNKTAPVLALPGPDGTVQAVGGDPFAASLSVPPPAYVQISDMERKQYLLVQEQTVWQQYSRQGMQGTIYPY